MIHINSIIPDSLDPLQFTYRLSSTVCGRRHLPYTTHCPGTPKQKEHLCQTVVYWLQLCFQHHRSLQTDPETEGPRPGRPHLQLDYGRPQVVTIGTPHPLWSSTLECNILSYLILQGCCLSPWLYSLFKHKWQQPDHQVLLTSSNSSNFLILVGLMDCLWRTRTA